MALAIAAFEALYALPVGGAKNAVKASPAIPAFRKNKEAAEIHFEDLL